MTDTEAAGREAADAYLRRVWLEAVAVTGIHFLLDPGWLYIRSNAEPPYEIAGKYLFYAPGVTTVIRLAIAEIRHRGFHHAKVAPFLIRRATDHVLCLYYANDSRKHELRERYGDDSPSLRYRYWKSDADTLDGKYSKQFLDAVKNEPHTSSRSRSKSPPADSLPELRENRGLKQSHMKWEADEDARLVAEDDLGAPTDEIARAHGRSAMAIRSRLVKLGRIPQDPERS